MKKVCKKNYYCFHSISAPCDFLARLKEEAIREQFKIEVWGNSFKLRIDSNHGGEVFFDAEVKADEKGGSFINGEIITVPWKERSEKKKNTFQKILTILGYIVISPLLLIILLFTGIYQLILYITHNNEPSVEEKLTRFMTKKMCCKSI